MPGSAAKVTAEQVTQIVALACESPELGERQKRIYRTTGVFGSVIFGQTDDRGVAWICGRRLKESSTMEGVTTERVTDELLMVAARALTGRDRRVFQGRVCLTLCERSPRNAEARFGWGRENVARGLQEFEGREPDAVDKTDRRRGRLPSEAKNPQLATDIRLIVEPHTQSDPELKSSRQYTNLSAAEVREALLAKGYEEARLPSERTIRDILNRMNYRLKRIQKGKPLKKTQYTDAIFENVKASRRKYADDPETLEISVDTKAKVSLGEYALGGKNTNRQ